jgi:hypothetical protein
MIEEEMTDAEFENMLTKPAGWWTLDKCQAEAMKYQTRKEFHDKSAGAYDAARRNGWIDQICPHMPASRRNKYPPGWWNYERCKVEALKYTKRNDFKNNSSGGYHFACEHYFIDEICGHMIACSLHPSRYWTFERCWDEAMKYTSMLQWKTENASSVVAAKREGWMKDIKAYMHLPAMVWIDIDVSDL